jgi:hypothetical protein
VEHAIFVRRGLAYLGLAAWVAVCIVIGALLLARHLLTMPTPGVGDPVLRAAIHAQRRADQRGWLVLHVLYDACGCSARVLDHLLHTTRPSGIAERVVYIAEDPVVPTLRHELRARGFELDVVSPEQLRARYDLEAAPLLVIVDPTDDVRYLGGYTSRKQGADVRDLGVIAMTRLGLTVPALPAFGCAVGAALRARLNPFE